MQYQAIFGLETNFDSNTPQGQFFNILAQAKMDIEDLLQSIYAQRDPDSSIGEGLDTVCGYNDIFRQNATYTQQNIQITTDRQVTTVPNAIANPPYSNSWRYEH